MSSASTADHHNYQHEKIRLLHVDDDSALADLTATFLLREDDRFDIEIAHNVSEGLDCLTENDFDCIVSDYDMPGKNGIEFLETVREDYADLPFILFTGKGSEEVASDAISAGATDYLQKGGGTDKYELLANRARNAVDQYRATREAQTVQRRLQELAESTADCLWMFDHNWDELLFISGYEDVWNRPTEAIKENPQDFLDGVDPDDQDFVKKAMSRLSTGESIDIEYKIRRGDDEPGWVWVKGEPIFDDDGNVVRVVGFTRDITERKEHEQELQRKERRYQAVFNDPNILAGLLDTDGAVLEINRTAMEYVDASLDEVRNTPFWETPWFDHSESLQDEVQDWIDRAASGEYVEFEADLVRPEGGSYTVKGVFRPVMNDDGEVVSLFISDRDISEQKEREHELETMSRRLEAILDNTTTPMFMKDDEGRYVFVNRGYRELFDLNDTEIVGRTDHELHPSEMAEQVQANDRLVLERGETVETEEHITAAGTKRTFLSTKVPIYDTGGRSDPEQPVAVFGVASDITELKTREHELKETNAILSTLFETLPVGILAQDTSRNVLAVNEQLFTLFDLPTAPEKIIGTDCERLVEQVSGLIVDSEEFAERIHDLVANRESIDNEQLSLNDGRTFERSYRTIQLPNADGHLWMYRDVTERKERNQRYDAIFNNTYQFTGLLEPDGTLIEANETALEFGGLDREDVLGKKMWEAYWFQHSEDTRQQAREAVERAANGEFVRHELPVQGATDEVIIDFSVRPLTDDQGNVTLLIPEGRNITELKEQERELRDTRRYLDLMLEGTETGIWEWKIDTNEVEWNETLERAFGLEPGSFEGTYEAFAKRVHPDDVSQVEEAIDRAIETGEPYQEEFRMTQDDGTIVWAEDLGLIIEENDEPDRMVGLFRDISERKEREARLSGLNETMRHLIATDTRTQICEIGVEAARDVLGLDANAIHLYDDEQAALIPIAATDTVGDLVGDLPTFTGGSSIGWRAYEQGDTVVVNDVHNDPDVYNPETPIKSELHLPLGEYGILIAGSDTQGAFDQQDIVFGEILAGGITTALEQVERTEQVHAREQALRRQNERLAEFASIVSHDLRNPLNVAQGRLELAQGECDSEHFDHMSRALKRMNTLIDDLLTLAREGNQVGELEAVHLGDLTENCWQNVATAEATLITEIDRQIPADRSRFQQLLENLLRNAIEHGGENVTITVGELEDGFYVEDNGSGIREAERDDIFRAGYSTSENGTGFGLSIVKQVSHAHGWDVRVTDGAEGGARFEITGVEGTDIQSLTF